MSKNELFEIQKLLERIEKELLNVKESLSGYFAREEQAMLASEVSIERSNTLMEDVPLAAAREAEYLKPDVKGPERGAKEIRL